MVQRNDCPDCSPFPHRRAGVVSIPISARRERPLPRTSPWRADSHASPLMESKEMRQVKARGGVFGMAKRRTEGEAGPFQEQEAVHPQKISNTA